ncbi:GNAT family N-acetyltransferase [Epidermidibacterium keratini]|uniref:GNAT family N-acetyltransferase n=1 Tax=Epidermidibacterium keratini TaxID=1891644 RepID=A0A7L4YS07_9ACTN|nr:GNAT family N-acetyltransferase [Epidermidibacterium keratini]QHC01946.1 GNAT family N-acetyltransferase [Epidermidibacterium keratini]
MTTDPSTRTTTAAVTADPAATEAAAAEPASSTAPSGDAPVANDDRPKSPQDYDYPRGWEADVIASDGGTVHVRPITPADADKLVAMHGRTSERTRYLRFFGPYPRVPARDLERFVNVDHHDRVALIVLLGNDIIGVGRYDRYPDSDTAEVAFLIEDAHQGRGLGPMLLEHLAAAARESGITRFAADVLAENGRMVRTFLDAGYSPSRAYEEGVVRLEFPVEPTETSQAVSYSREQRSEARSLERLLTATSVAVIGASNDHTKLGYAVVNNLLSFGLDGPIYPVNPTAAHVAGVPAYRSVLDIPHDLDLAVITVPADQVEGVVEECGQKNVRGLVVISGGFSEKDEHGRTEQQKLVETARAYGMRVVGPNCLGVVNTRADVRLNATISPNVPPPGRVGFFCQSGALGVAILADAHRRGLGMSTFVSAGNRADVSGNDLLQYWATDDRTEVILLHLESFGNPRKFARLTRQIARDKPIVAVKSGRHTGAKAGIAAAVPIPDDIVEALFESSGVMRVDTLEQSFDLAMLLAHQPLPRGQRVGVVGNSSALGLLVQDACLSNGLEVSEGYPVDIGPEGSVEAFESALAGALADDNVDSLVAVFVPPVVTDARPYAEALGRLSMNSEKPIVTTFQGISGIPAGLQEVGGGGELLRGSVPSYVSPERGVLALAKATSYYAWRSKPEGTPVDAEDVDNKQAAATIYGVLEKEPEGRVLSPEETEELLGAYGIVSDARDPGDDGIPVTIGLRDDSSFGALVSFGLSGLALELFHDTAYRALPLSDTDIDELIREPRAFPLLDGYRGQPKVDLDALHDLIARVVTLGEHNPEVRSLQLDPVIVTPDGACVTRASVRIGPPVNLGPRRLAPAI